MAFFSKTLIFSLVGGAERVVTGVTTAVAVAYLGRNGRCLRRDERRARRDGAGTRGKTTYVVFSYHGCETFVPRSWFFRTTYVVFPRGIYIGRTGAPAGRAGGVHGPTVTAPRERRRAGRGRGSRGDGGDGVPGASGTAHGDAVPLGAKGNGALGPRPRL